MKTFKPLKRKTGPMNRPINFLDNKIMRMVGQIRMTECTRSLRIINEK